MALQTPQIAQDLSEKAEQKPHGEKPHGEKPHGEKPQTFRQGKTMAKGEVTWQIVKY